MFAITQTYQGYRQFTGAARFTTVDAAKASISQRAAQGCTLVVTVDGGAFVPAGLDIEVDTHGDSAHRIYSRAMRCEFVVAPADLKASVELLCAEYAELKEAGEL